MQLVKTKVTYDISSNDKKYSIIIKFEKQRYSRSFSNAAFRFGENFTSKKLFALGNFLKMWRAA